MKSLFCVNLHHDSNRVGREDAGYRHNFWATASNRQPRSDGKDTHAHGAFSDYRRIEIFEKHRMSTRTMHLIWFSKFLASMSCLSFGYERTAFFQRGTKPAHMGSSLQRPEGGGAFDISRFM